MPLTGRCLCGAVRFTAAQVQAHVHACHCSMCRRWASGPVLAVRVGSVQFEGAEHLGRYTSSDWAERGFCRECGSSLFYHLKPSGQYLVTMGSFDDQTPFAMAGEIYIDAKPEAYAFAGDHERLTEAEFLAKLAPSASA